MKLKYLDSCLPDYFQGFGGETFAVPLCKGIRTQAVLDGLHAEIRGWSGHLCDRQATEEDFAALHADADELFKEVHMKAIWHPHVGDESYAYFGILVEETA